MNGLLILLGILKWIGIVLLALLLLILLIVLVVLLSPIRYRLEGEKKAELGGSFGVSWLFGAVKADGVYTQAESLKLKVKVLCFTVLGGEPKEKKEKKPKKEKKKKTPAAEELKPDIATAEKTDPPKQEEAKPKAEQPKEEKKQKPSPQRMEQKQPKTVRRVKLSEIEEKPPLEEDPLTEEEEAFFAEEAAEEKKEKIPPIVKEIWKIEDKKGIFQALGKLLKRLIKGILPGNLFLKGTIGTGDPTTTGYVLALAGILTTKFGNDIQIKGDFTKAAAEDIEVRIKGKIVLGGLVWAVLAFIFAKPVRKAIWKMIKFVLKQRKAEKGKGE